LRLLSARFIIGVMSALAKDLLNLPVEERLRLVEDLWESIREFPDSLPITEGQRDELDRRVIAHRSEPEAAETLEVVLERIRNRA
jgi:putative addiction module component (TIGR02574 family)